MSAVAAGLLAGLACVFARPVRGRAGVRLRSWAVLALVVVGAFVLWTGLPWRAVLPVVIGLGAVWGALAVRSRRLRARAAAATSALVQEVCELVSGELAAGLPVGRCLAEAATLWPPLASAATAQTLGASVPDALRTLSSRPGAGDLRLVAAAWQLAARSGSGLARSLSEVADTVRDRESTRRLVRSELASARSTARLMAVLPVLTLAMGSGAGGDPVSFLFGTTVGLACLAAGVTLSLLGLRWIEAISAGVEAQV